MGLKAKADLQITRNKLGEVQQESESLDRLIQDKKQQVQQQKTQIDNLKSQITEQ